MKMIPYFVSIFTSLSSIHMNDWCLHIGVVLQGKNRTEGVNEPK